jgi:glycosyltransferase involved in cell wall biosynthesis
MAGLHNLGIVVIGRNEGERLRVCLESLRDVERKVYVDSGSTDGSQALARRMGVTVVELPTPPNFTAARARNEGLAKLIELDPELKFVQMIDGDCEVAPHWLDHAAAALAADDRIAAVFGRLRERHPDASVYNMLCDDEWNVPVGEAASCGGNAMFRVEALTEAGGYSPGLIAGEEPDLCLRMRRKQWRIVRIDAEMGVHDAAISRFSQYWRRARRGGHACAELLHRHGRGSDPHWKRQALSTWVWAGGLLGGLSLGLIGLASGADWMLYAAAAAAGLFAAQTIRLVLVRRREGWNFRRAGAWAVLLMAGKIPQLLGFVQFHLRRGNSARLKLIEYKS